MAVTHIRRFVRTTVGGATRLIDLLRPAKPNPNVTSVTNLTQQSGYLPNPNIGYQGYTHAEAQITETLEYRRSNTVRQGGFDWADMNPAAGTYNWTPIDTLLTAAAGRGQQASFRVATCNDPDFGGHCVPAWAVTEGVPIDATRQEPDYRNRVYQTRWGQFVDAMAARYDGDPRIAFIDISGYGYFSEWQANASTDSSGADFEGTGTSVDASTRRHLVQMFTGGSGTAGVNETIGGTGTLTYSHTGFTQTQLVQPYGGIWATSRWVASNYPTVGFRNDALLGSDATFASFQAIGYGVTNIWRRAPVIFEPITGASSSNYPAGQTTMQGMGASLLHDNALPLSGLANFVAPLGYRYYCSKVQVPVTANVGSSIAVQTTWTNTGYAPAYTKMGQNFSLTIGFANASGTVLTSTVTGHSVSSWLPGVTQAISDTVTAPNVTGTVTVLIGIVNTVNNARIQLPVAAGGRTDKWYPAGTLTLV